MRQYLATGNFEENEITEGNKDHLLESILDTKSDHKHGYLTQSHLEHPPKIHDKPNIFEFVQRKKQSGEIFSNYLMETNSLK